MSTKSKFNGYLLALLLFALAFFLSSSPGLKTAFAQAADSDLPANGELSQEGSDGSWIADSIEKPVPDGTTVQVPILMYHAFTEGTSVSSDLYVTRDRFRQQIQALQSAGYTFISCQDLQDFVFNGKALPQNPILLTCDDGYLDNYQIAYPVLQETQAKMTIFTVGISIGKDTYRDTNQPILPHFTFAQASEMIASGLVEIGSHTYDLHRNAALEGGRARNGMDPLPGESKESYLELATADLHYMYQQLSLATGSNRTILAFPQGANHLWAQEAAAASGITLTCTTQKGANTIVCGVPESLLNLNRYTVTNDLTAGKLLQLLQENL